jgi:2'-5' RNA ligase
LVQNELANVKFPSFSLRLKNRVETFPAKAMKNIRVIHMPLYYSPLDSSDIENKNEEEVLSEELDDLKKAIDLAVEKCSSLEEDFKQDVIYKSEDIQVKDERNDAMDISMETSKIIAMNPASTAGKDKKQRKQKKKEIFHPHLTLARVKQYCKVQEVFDLINDMNSKIQDPLCSDFGRWNSMVLPVTSFILFRSHLTSKGSIYEVIQEYTCCDS